MTAPGVYNIAKGFHRKSQSVEALFSTAGGMQPTAIADVSASDQVYLAVPDDGTQPARIVTAFGFPHRTSRHV